MTWGIFKDGDRAFDLTHLDETVISVGIEGEAQNIVVEFSDHCFTEDAGADDERPRFEGCSRKDGRFCEKRYEASLRLLDHIRHATLGSVWLGEGNRCIVVKLRAVIEGDAPLHLIVPFSLERMPRGDERAKLKMIVRSAFLRNPDRRVATFGSVKFVTLIEHTLNGKNVKRSTDARRRQPW